MPTRAILGIGARVRIGRGATPTWTTLRECRDVTTPNSQRADIDVTNHDSANLTEENILGLFGAVDFSVEHTYVQASTEDVLILDLIGTGELVLLGITPAGQGATEETWLARVKGYEVSHPVKTEQRATVTLRVMNRVAD